ncbi:MAG: response regulator [Magnetococcales bacterium]|nr:response regulator [Magnetococcales bacterium]
MTDKTLLIVDDNVVNATLLTYTLSNYHTRIAHDGKTALQLAHSEERPDLILLDVMMPGMDGYEVCRQLKADPRTASIPVLFVTSKTDMEDEAKGLALGAVDFISKPIQAAIVQARVRTHLALQERQQDLERQVEKQTTELRASMQAAEAANRAKSEFLSNMSHEIRSPMNAILGMTDLVLNSPITDEQRTNLEIVQESAENLLALINDVLDFSKIEAGQLTLERIPFDLRGQLEDKCAGLALAAHKKGLELYLDIAPEVPGSLLGDPLRLKQILVNLVNNAIKFTEEGEVVVRVRRLPPDADPDDERVGLHFSVADTGIGIPANRKEAIFQRFTQVDSSVTRKYGGTGLGLTICQQLVQMMGGSLGVESQEGKGSLFQFTIHFQVGQRLLSHLGWLREERRSRQEPFHLAGVRILLGDNNASGRAIVTDMLTRCGAIVTAVADSVAFIAAWRHALATQYPFTVLLLDHGLTTTKIPEIEQMSQTAEGANRLILLSPTDLSGENFSAIHPYPGCHSLRKPVRLYTLLKSIDRILGKETTSGHPSPPLPPPSSSPPVQAIRILLVEDMVDNQRLATLLLQRAGYDISVANNGREGLERLQKECFDLVLMDINMPVMDGIEATRHIRNSTCGAVLDPHIPIVAVTALVMQEEETACLAVGMNGYLRKPYRKEELLQVVEQFARKPLHAPPPPPPSGATPVIKPVANPEQLANRVQILLDEGPRHLRLLHEALTEQRVDPILKELVWLKTMAVESGADRVKIRTIRLKGIAELKNWEEAWEVYRDLEQEFQRALQALSTAHDGNQP